ncbi:hypothetical protein ASZ78_014455 [Callipepla squamata]|uniref:Coiled-coil domain-containing protein 125 n=1 Tax=Callipepla squamata TaxID=9009 RepID=A0A226N4J2_CALSU|nr:hypothetical protein ASZ78_014455 [Callipepla squamata]
MEEAEEDDVESGDLGNGLRRPGGVYEGEKSRNCSFRSKKLSVKAYSALSSIKGVEENDAAPVPCPKRNSFHDGSSKRPLSSSARRSSCESNSEVSKELRQQLQEALEEIEMLRDELETTQRQLEGKDQALSILQSMVGIVQRSFAFFQAVFSKATSHTKAMLEKTEEEKRTLEKEINILQWEIEFDQDRFRNIEDTWTKKYDRIYCENAALKEALKLRTEEVKTLKSENAILNQQHLEFLAMLDVNKQKIVQENMSVNKRDITDITGLEFVLDFKLAVLGACTCNSSGGQPCSCAKMAAVTRKQILHLRQEVMLFDLAVNKERSQEKFVRKTKAINALPCLTQTVFPLFSYFLVFIGSAKLQGYKNSLGQKLSGLLSSDTDSSKVEELDNPHEILKMLIDLVNDKEEALAHQRKVSYMLARAMELKEAAQETQGLPVVGHGGKAVQPSGTPAVGHTCCCDVNLSSPSSASHGNGCENSVSVLQKSHSWPS